MSNEIIFESDVECYSCNGTGLYKGIAERGSSAVICHTCEGTGKKHVKHVYKKFKGRKKKDDVKRVYKTCGGFGITDVDSNGIEFSKAGCRYSDWLSGVTPKPIEDLHCPLLHFGQGSKETEQHFKNVCDKKIMCGDSITQCAKQHRSECWEFFNK